MVASRDENKPPNKLVVYPLTVPSGREVQLYSVSRYPTFITFWHQCLRNLIMGA